jgi:sterol desaturase/sphingolipid hydroxylase (fatty acid hydroxylase superfamily)
VSIAEPRAIGSGWVSGTASITLGAMGLGAVLCLLFPAELTTPELRAVYPMAVVRALIQAVIVAAFVSGLLSIVLRKSKRLGLAGLSLAIVSVLLGGSSVPVDGPVPLSHHLGLDWFLLDLLLMGVLFLPLERAFARVAQPIFRTGFTTDVVYFFVGHVLIQVLVFFTVTPASLFFGWARHPSFQRAVASQPALIQFAEIVLVSDVFQYAAHRLFHRVPWLWRVHAIHHPTTEMDWLAGSRLHIVDILVVRAIMFIPLFILGFAEAPVRAYIVFVALHAVLLHANVRFRFGWFDWLVTTPRYHQFHHAAEGPALNKNFALHLPFLDRLFGTQYLPDGAWPTRMGTDGDPVPQTWSSQLVYPFRSSPKGEPPP